MDRLFYCINCINNKQINYKTEIDKQINKSREKNKSDFANIPLIKPIIRKEDNSIITNGFIKFHHSRADHSKCPYCNGETVELSLTTDDWDVLKQISTDADFILEMDKLKKTDIVDFNLKLSQFKANAVASQPVSPPPQPSNVPKCPTCGSTNIKRISGTKRWVGTGIFGLASSSALKSYECKNCSYKW